MKEKHLLIILVILIIIVGIIFFIDNIPSETYSKEDIIFQPTQTADWNLYGNNTKVEVTKKGFHFTTLKNETNTVSVFKKNSIHSFNGTEDLVFEFDYRTANQFGMYLVTNDSGRVTVGQSTDINNWVHEKWVYDSSKHTVTEYINGEKQSPLDLSSQNMDTLGFQVIDWQGDIDLYIDNWKVCHG